MFTYTNHWFLQKLETLNLLRRQGEMFYFLLSLHRSLNSSPAQELQAGEFRMHIHRVETTPAQDEDRVPLAPTDAVEDILNGGKNNEKKKICITSYITLLVTVHHTIKIKHNKIIM